jgi:outer membrane protein assembly factor BamB
MKQPEDYFLRHPRRRDLSGSYRRGHPDSILDHEQLDGTTIFCAETNGSVYAYDGFSGHLRWSRAMHFRSIDAPFTEHLLVATNSVYATFTPGDVDPTMGNPPVPGIVILSASTGSLIWQKMITTPQADDPNSDTIIGILVHNGILYVTQSKYKKPPETGTIEQITALIATKKRSGRSIGADTTQCWFPERTKLRLLY